jgi:hypothetical protein
VPCPSTYIGYRQLREEHSGLYLVMDRSKMEVFVGEFAGSLTSFKVDIASGVFYSDADDDLYVVGTDGKKLVPVLRDTALIVNSTLEYGKEFTFFSFTLLFFF